MCCCVRETTGCTYNTQIHQTHKNYSHCFIFIYYPLLHSTSRFSGIPGSKTFSPLTGGAGAAMKTLEDTSSKVLTDLINCDGCEGVYLDHQRQMKFKKGSPRTHLRIFQCPFLPNNFIWTIINVTLFANDGQAQLPPLYKLICCLC